MGGSKLFLFKLILRKIVLENVKITPKTYISLTYVFFCCWNFNTYYSFWKLQIKHVKATAYQNCNPTVAIPEDSFVNINDELLQIR